MSNTPDTPNDPHAPKPKKPAPPPSNEGTFLGKTGDFEPVQPKRPQAVPPPPITPGHPAPPAKPAEPPLDELDVLDDDLELEDDALEIMSPSGRHVDTRALDFMSEDDDVVDVPELATDRPSPFDPATPHEVWTGDFDAMDVEMAREGAARVNATVQDERFEVPPTIVSDAEVFERATRDLEVKKVHERLADKRKPVKGRPAKAVKAEPAKEKPAKKKKSRLFRRATLAVVFVFVVIPILALVAGFFARNAVVKWAVEGPVADSLGLVLTVGNVTVEIGDDVGITLTDLQALVPADLTAEEKKLLTEKGLPEDVPLFSMDKLVVTLDKGELMWGRFKATFTCDEPTVTIVRRRDGRLSYDTAPPQEGAKALTDKPAPAPQLQAMTDPVTGEPIVDEANPNKRAYRNPATGEVEFLTEEEHEERQTELDLEAQDFDESDLETQEERSTFDELRRLVETLLERYGQYEEIMAQARAMRGEEDEDGEADEDAEEWVRENRVGEASYLVAPEAEEAPPGAGFTLSAFTIRNARVRLVDLREGHDADPRTEQVYNLDLRNISSNRLYQTEPPVIFLQPGELPEGESPVEAFLSLLRDESAFASFAADMPFEGFQHDWQRYLAAKSSGASAVDPRPFLTAFQLRLDRDYPLNDLLGFAGVAPENLPFADGSVRLYTASVSTAGAFILEETSWQPGEIPEYWQVDPVTGRTVEDAPGLPEGPMTLFGSDMSAVLVLQFHDVALAEGFMGLPQFALDIVGRFLEGTNWRFVVALEGPITGPSVRLANAPELTARLKYIATDAVQEIAQDLLADVLGIFLSDDGIRDYEVTYGANPAQHIVWEASTLTPAELDMYASHWRDATGQELPFESVVSALVWSSEKSVFVQRLGNNTFTVARIVVVKIVDDLATQIGTILFDFLPLPAGFDEETAIEQLKFEVAERLVPEGTLNEDLQVEWTGGDPGDRMSDALMQVQANAQPILVSLIEGYLSALLDAVPEEMFPASYDREAMNDQMVEGVAAALLPMPAPGESLQPDLPAARSQLTRNTQVVLGSLANAYLGELVGTVLTGLDTALDTDLATRQDIQDRMKAGVAEALFVLTETDGDAPSLDVNVEAGVARLQQNAILLAPEIADIVMRPRVTQTLQTIESAGLPLPEGMTASSMTDRLMRGVADALITADSIELDADGTLARDPEPHLDAALAVLNENATGLARDIVDGYVVMLTSSGVDAIGGAFGLDAGQRAQLGDDLSDGVGTAIVGAGPSLAFDMPAGLARFRANVGRVAGQFAQAMVDEIGTAAVGQVVGVIEPLPAGWDSDRVSEEVMQGVAAALFPPESIAVTEAGDVSLAEPDMDAAQAQAQTNMIRVAGLLGDAYAVELARPAAGVLVAAMPEPPADVDEDAVAQQLGTGVGSAMVGQDEAGDLTFTPEAGYARIAENAIPVARTMSEGYIRGLAGEVIDAVIGNLAQDGDPIDRENLIDRSTAGVAIALWPAGSITVDEAGSFDANPDTDAAQARMQYMARSPLTEVTAMLLRRRAADALRTGSQALLTDAERAGYDFEARAALVFTPADARAYVDGDEAERQALTASLPEKIDPALDALARDVLVLRVDAMVRENDVRLSPPLTRGEVPPEAGAELRADPTQSATIVKDIIKENDRVLLAIAASQGVRPNPPLVTRAQIISNMRGVVDRW